MNKIDYRFEPPDVESLPQGALDESRRAIKLLRTRSLLQGFADLDT
jgi:hypothetical protein